MLKKTAKSWKGVGEKKKEEEKRGVKRKKLKEAEQKEWKEKVSNNVKIK